MAIATFETATYGLDGDTTVDLQHSEETEQQAALRACLGAKGFNAATIDAYLHGQRDNLLGPEDHLYSPAERALRNLL